MTVTKTKLTLFICYLVAFAAGTVTAIVWSLPKELALGRGPGLFAGLDLTEEQRQQALDRLLPIQRADFNGLFKVMAPRHVTIRLLDPPIHEFLPSEQQLLQDLQVLRHLLGAE